MRTIEIKLLDLGIEEISNVVISTGYDPSNEEYYDIIDLNYYKSITRKEMMEWIAEDINDENFLGIFEIKIAEELLEIDGYFFRVNPQSIDLNCEIIELTGVNFILD
jgi:hypothetical protein